MKEQKRMEDDSGCPDNKEDITLLRSFLTGNDHAFSSIYNKYVAELFGYGIGLGSEREMLKDAIQDVFYTFYVRKNQLTEVRNLKYYLFRMLKNRLLDMYKSTVHVNEAEPPEEMSFTIKTTILDELIAEEEKTALQIKIDTLLSTLTSRQKEAVYLRFMQEMEYEEIGRLLEMTPQAVRKLIFRAIKRLREENIPFYLLF
ncbi:MAG: sigma-70 family RNA polymerase sigma factor [Tannerella sp.]|jgi:RNA polymerase sigma factor (sigma-70 family)|nr:sigma-70 family RNA polymerase sigma factor [Tannerella sp.]